MDGRKALGRIGRPYREDRKEGRTEGKTEGRINTAKALPRKLSLELGYGVWDVNATEYNSSSPQTTAQTFWLDNQAHTLPLDVARRDRPQRDMARS